MKNNEREDAAVVSALQTTIVTGNEVDGSMLPAAHGLREEGDEPLVWQQEGEVIQIEHHYRQRCADGQRALRYEEGVRDNTCSRNDGNTLGGRERRGTEKEE